MYTIKDVKDKKIVEVRNFLDHTQLTDLWYKANECDYTYGRVTNSYSSNRQGRMTHNFDATLFKETDVWKSIEKFVEGPIELVENYICYSESSTINYSHCDSPSDVISILLNINIEWKRDWGGYTSFFAGPSSSEVIFTSIPEPGKAVFFNGTIWHYAAPVTSIAAHPRFMMIFKTFHEELPVHIQDIKMGRE